MRGKRQAINVAYSVSTKHGRNYHARAYCEEHGFDGVPDSQSFKSAAGIGNNSDSPDAACRAAVAELLMAYPEFSGVQVFSYGRQSGEIVGAAPVISYRGRNWSRGVAHEFSRPLD